MDSKLKLIRAGHKGAVKKLLVKFNKLKSITNTEVEEVKALDDAVTQKQKTLIDLYSRLLDGRILWNRKLETPMSICISSIASLDKFANLSSPLKQTLKLLMIMLIHQQADLTQTHIISRQRGKHHTSICKGKEVNTGTKPEPKIQQTAINIVETTYTTSLMYASKQSHDILLKIAIAPVIYYDQGNTAIDNKNRKYTAKLPWKHNHPDLPSNMAIAKSRTKNTLQWLVQSRPHKNPLEEKLKGSNLLPRLPERLHPQLVESRTT
ncbi:unnamed protein product [Mytilus coruscus]|uniref:Uncharacterized protein n=1 Tax=Mytilus coruscus TaxID=42192 RepID=A0A6J8CRP1_MYTCO|nr:unnamed protein product [Mytilus coruscus]